MVLVVHGVGVVFPAVGGHVVALAGLPDVSVENHLAVYRHGDAVSHGAYLLDVPCSQGREFHAFGRDNSVDRSVLLVYAQVLVDRSVVVEHLNLHAVIGGVDAHGGAYADAVVDALSVEGEFESQDEITVLLLGVEVARSAVLRRHVDRSVDGDVVGGVPGPLVHRRTVEEHLEAVGSLFLREFEARRGGQFADVHFADVEGRISRDEQDLSLCVGGNLPVACVFEDYVLGGRDAVEYDRHAVADHLHLHRVPLLRAVRGRFGCGVVVEHVARQGSGVLSSECDLRDRADAHRGLAFGLPVEDQFEVFVIFRRSDRSSVSGPGQDAVFCDPVLRHRGPGLCLRFRQRLGLHRLAGLGIADHGFPSARFERYREVSLCGEFGQESLDLVDGVTCVGVGFGQSGIYLLGLFQGCCYRFSSQRGVLRSDGLHDHCGGFGRRGCVHVVHGKRQRREYRGFGERFEQFVLHLGRGFRLQSAAV
ncbi:unknown [Alistipes sp. CAG:53]|nr:unknown [Alistipes sp. CAG:53]